MFKGFIFTALLFCCSAVDAQSFDHGHPRFTQVLAEYVLVADDGLSSNVNYKALADNRDALDTYLASLSEVTEAAYRDWSEHEQLTFLINAYNGFTLQLIIDHIEDFESGGARSIRDLGSLFTSPWEQSFFTLLGKERTLDWVEHEKIRVDFAEPRIHAALVCAAISCPKLRAEAFAANNLEAQLEDQMVSFLRDRDKNGVDARGIYLSKIFDWYRDDFNGLHTYLQDYADALSDSDEQRQRLLNGDLDIRFTDYNWRLNGVTHP